MTGKTRRTGSFRELLAAAKQREGRHVNSPPSSRLNLRISAACRLERIPCRYHKVAFVKQDFGSPSGLIDAVSGYSFYTNKSGTAEAM
jgi:hypothetical protein